MLEPGRLRLETRPAATGSAPIEKTIGIIAVAALAASTAGRGDPRSPAGGPARPRAPAVVGGPLPPGVIRPPHSGLRHSPIPSAPRGPPRSAGATARAMRH